MKDKKSSDQTNKAKKKGRRNPRDRPAGPNPNEWLNISFDAYQHFAKLSLAAPGTVGEVPAMGWVPRGDTPREYPPMPHIPRDLRL